MPAKKKNGGGSGGGAGNKKTKADTKPPHQQQQQMPVDTIDLKVFTGQQQTTGGGGGGGAGAAVAAGAAAASGSGTGGGSGRGKHSHSHSHSHSGGGAGHPHSHGGGGGGGGVMRDTPTGGNGGSGTGSGSGSAPRKSESEEEADHFIDVIKHFEHYGTHTFQRIGKIDSDFQRMSKEMKALVPGWDDKMKSVRAGIVANHHFIRSLTDHRKAFMNSADVDYDALEMAADRPDYPYNEERMSKVRSTLRQCMRDWSKEGSTERAACYGVMLHELEKLYPTFAERKGVRVLVPGCGLARLVWEIASRGFESQGNEFSYFMLVASFYILNCINKPESIALYPFIHDTKNVLHVRDQLRSILIPDVNPSQLPAQAGFSMVAGDFLEVFSDPSQRGTWNVVMTCFFIDTANSIIEYLRLINWLLKPGGVWINFGPLLYHYSEMDTELSVELSYEELRACFGACGFKILKEQTDMKCPYASNIHCLLQQTYSCVLTVATKTSEGMGWNGSQVRRGGGPSAAPTFAEPAQQNGPIAAAAAERDFQRAVNTYSAPSAAAQTATAAPPTAAAGGGSNTGAAPPNISSATGAAASSKK